MINNQNGIYNIIVAILMSSEGLYFDILDDLSDELKFFDYLQFTLINDLTYELEYRTDRFIAHFYRINKEAGGYSNRYIWDYTWTKIFECGSLKVIKWFCEKQNVMFRGTPPFQGRDATKGSTHHNQYFRLKARNAWREDIIQWINDHYPEDAIPPIPIEPGIAYLKLDPSVGFIYI